MEKLQRTIDALAIGGWEEVLPKKSAFESCPKCDGVQDDDNNR